MPQHPGRAQPRVLICGAGIAGLTLAWLLQRAGWAVTVIEIAPGPRGPGYMIDFFGPGYDTAERLELLPALEAVHRPIARLTFRGREGRVRAALDYAVIRKYVFNGRHFNFLRGDLEQVLRRRAAEDGVAPVFGRSIDGLSARHGGMDVTFDDGTRAHVDLVVGADGVRSHVRSLAFGPHAAFTRSLGYDTAAYVITDRTLVATIGDEFATLTVPGRQLGLYPMDDSRVATFFLYATTSSMLQPSRERICSELRARYEDFGWAAPDALRACDSDERPYYDDVTQVVMPQWSNGRVTLVGDACGAVSLAAGQGASLALSGAACLASCLGTGSDVVGAIRTYEQTFRPVIEHRQRAGRRLAHWLLPDTRWRLALRDGFLKLGSLPALSRLAGRSLAS